LGEGNGIGEPSERVGRGETEAGSRFHPKQLVTRAKEIREIQNQDFGLIRYSLLSYGLLNEIIENFKDNKNRSIQLLFRQLFPARAPENPQNPHLGKTEVQNGEEISLYPDRAGNRCPNCRLQKKEHSIYTAPQGNCDATRRSKNARMDELGLLTQHNNA
jgi:hypothetical protein